MTHGDAQPTRHGTSLSAASSRGVLHRGNATGPKVHWVRPRTVLRALPAWDTGLILSSGPGEQLLKHLRTRRSNTHRPRLAGNMQPNARVLFLWSSVDPHTLGSLLAIDLVVSALTAGQGWTATVQQCKLARRSGGDNVIGCARAT